MSKIVVVTGASSGIGAAIVRVLSDQGHTVIGLARRSENIDEIAKENPSRKLHSYKIDITVDADVIKAFEWIKSKFGKIDVMINNAGVNQLTLVSDGDVDVWRKIYALNVFAAGKCTAEALKIIADDGNIINISSVLGQEICSAPGISVYSSTKHAIKILTKGLRFELNEKRPGIKVTLLNPGLIKTEMTTGLIESGLITTPYIPAEEIAKAAAYIISTPQFINVTEMTVQHSNEVVK